MKKQVCVCVCVFVHVCVFVCVCIRKKTSLWNGNYNTFHIACHHIILKQALEHLSKELITQQLN